MADDRWRWRVAEKTAREPEGDRDRDRSRGGLQVPVDGLLEAGRRTSFVIPTILYIQFTVLFLYSLRLGVRPPPQPLLQY